MKPLSPLSAAAREMLEAGSRVQPPSAEQSERMARTLAPLFESGAGALSGGVQALRGPGASSRLSLGGSGKLLLAVGAIVASNGASFWFGRVSSRMEQAAPQAAVVAAPAIPVLPAALPVVSARSTPLAEPPAEPPSEPLHSAKPVASSLPSTPPGAHSLPSAQRAPLPPRAAGLRADIRRLSRADAQLRAGNPSDALRLLAPPVVNELREQAAALRAVAGCMAAASRAAGAADVATAERDARAMLERFPDSPYEARVRSACSE